MKLIENPAAAHALLQKVREKDSDREPGLHVSDLLYCARKAWVRRNNPGLSSETDDDTLIFLLGKGHHVLLERDQAESKVVLQLGNGDGAIPTHGTIDNVQWEGEGPSAIPVPVEFKTTRASSNKPITESANYLDQLGSYCAAIGVTHGRLIVLYISGNYKPPSPKIKAFDVYFDQEELDNWVIELGDRAEAIIDPTMPSLDMHYTWECDRCPIKSLINCPGGKGAYDGGFFRTLTEPWNLMET